MQEEIQSPGRSSLLVALAALCWGLSGGIGGILMVDGWDPFVVSFYRGAIGLVFVIGWLMVRPQENGLDNRKLWGWSALAGLGVAGNFAFYFVSIAEGSVAVAATLMYSAPVFVYLISFGLKLESPTPVKWGAIMLVIVGIVMLTQIYDVRAGGVTPIGIGSGLLAGISYAMFIFGFKNAARYGSPPAILMVAFAVLVIILLWPSDATQMVTALTTPDWAWFLALGVMGAGLSFILYILGLKYTEPTVASIMAMIEPVTASLFGLLVLDEGLTGLQIVGMALILVTVTALSVYRRYTEHPASLPTD